MKIFFCPKCHEKLHLFTSDKDGDLCLCVQCGAVFEIDFSKLFDEFDFENHPYHNNDVDHED
jgi:transcription elongation factor Elf1